MYLVLYKNILGGNHLEECETLEEATLKAKRLIKNSQRDVRIAKDIPMKVSIEF